MFIKRSKYEELIDSVEKLTKEINDSKAVIESYKKQERNSDDRLSSALTYINNYLENNFDFICCNKLRNFVRGQVNLLIGFCNGDESASIKEFNTSDKELAFSIEQLIVNASTLDSYLSAEGLTIRKK